jgi:hypothetical protein
MRFSTLGPASVLLLTAVTGCNVVTLPDSPPAAELPGEEVDPQVPECTELRASTEGLLRERCAGCHDNGNTKGGLGGVSDLDGLIDAGYVVRGDAEHSELYIKVESGAMPVDGERLSDDELAGIQRWIDVCTVADEQSEDLSLSEPPSCLDNGLMTPDDVLDAIRADIASLSPERARTTRYLTFAHLHSAGFCEQQLEGYRHALAKLINHLSLAPKVHVPEAIDAARTIYRIDLNDYDWSKQTWATITEQDPYAVVFESEEARIIQDLAGTAIFSVKGDWFIEAASQPPLYHDILEIPTDRFALEASLGLDVEANIADERTNDDDDVLRAGFQESKVSDFNRVIERHQLPSAPQRAYWLSYDFGDEDGVKNIFDRPLDFVQDGGEIIFTLPNGLQAYMLVDDVGNRIDRGPIGIVHDKETPEEPEVINGLSCMSCHSEGMRLATDEIAAYVANNTLFDDQAQEQVAKLYAPSDEFSRVQQQDVATFAASMALTGAPLRVGSHEPVMAAHLAFDGPLDLRRAASEFGVAESELLKNVSKLQGLTGIDRVSIDRDKFQLNFAANACVLNLGETVACPAEPEQAD